MWTPDASPVRIPELKVRALLAQLVVGAGRVVPADRLINDLWGETLPANPAGALQTRVSQLRRALEDAEPGARELVVSRAPGYLLDVARDAVDVTRFEDLVGQAGAARDPGAKVTLLGDALALWRGQALADFADDEFARAAITRLEELRLTAVEQQAAARLELGEHGVLADELGGLVADHPLRERLRAVHLRALYRAGRQSEALASYRALRDRLVEELGVEPSPELAALHQAILVQEPSLGATPAAPPPTNLPHPTSDLVGRTTEIEQVRSGLATDRLVTLTGPGGVGKTRLALAAAREPAGRFPDGTWWVELGSLPATARRDDVAELVAATLGVRDDTRAELVATLAEALRAKRMLLVLDNCEHVVAPVAELTATLLATGAELRVLATSQRPLGVAGELLRAVPPLPEPSAVRLFVTRAAAGAPGFALDDGNAATIAAICRRLDGIPLAIELAATRVRALGVHELAARLDDRLRVLGAGQRAAPSRHRSLRAMIDWSWELLGEAERTVLRRLAVYADGWTLASAEVVCGEENVDVLDVLAGLVDRSLVTVLATDERGGPRYRLLESVAEYCAERLTEAGERAEIARRHREFYARLAATAEPLLRGPEQREWLRRLDSEAANLRVAMDDAARDGAATTMVNSLAWYWVLRGRLREGRRALTVALAGADVVDPRTVTARIWLAAFTLRMGEVVEPPLSGPPPGDIGELAGRARAEWFLALASVGVGAPSAGEELADRALATFTAIGDQWGMAAVLSTKARQALMRSDLTALAAHGERSRALFTELGDRWGQLEATFWLGPHAEIAGDYERAARLHRDGLRLAEELGMWTAMADKLSELGRIALLTGDHRTADDFHERARALAVAHGYTVGEEYAELGLALSERRTGRFDEAEIRLRKWLEWDRRLGSDVALSLILAELGFLSEQQGDPAAARTLHLESLAAARNADDRRAVALAVEGLAAAAAAAGSPGPAARLLGLAAAVRESVGAPLPHGERGDVERVTATATGVLGPAGFAAEFDRGRHLDESEVDSVVTEMTRPGPR